MSSLDFSNVLRVFRDSKPSDIEAKQLYTEVLVMVLSRGTSADTNVDEQEVSTVVKILCRETGENISAAQIRVASRSEIFEKRSIDRYLARIRHKLPMSLRVRIVERLAEVIKSDVKIRPAELDYFDMVAGALNVKPHELAGMAAGDLDE